MNRKKIYVVSWYTAAEYGFIASWADKTTAERFAELAKKVDPSKAFKVELVEIEDMEA